MTDAEWAAVAAGQRPVYDMEWFACDAAGHVAMLTSAGFGPIPLDTFRDRGAYSDVLGYFDTLPTRGAFQLCTTGMGTSDSYTSAAERGLFAFDYFYEQERWPSLGPYRLVAKPSQPLSLSELAPNVREWLEPLCFSGLNFADVSEIRVEQWFQKVNLARENEARRGQPPYAL